MKLKLDQFIIEPKPDESLYDIVKSLGLVTGSLTTDPIAAKIAGRVFTLNYVPLRQKEDPAVRQQQIRQDILL